MEPQGLLQWSLFAPPAALNAETSFAPHWLINRLIDCFVFGKPHLRLLSFPAAVVRAAPPSPTPRPGQDLERLNLRLIPSAPLGVWSQPSAWPDLSAAVFGTWTFTDSLSATTMDGSPGTRAALECVCVLCVCAFVCVGHIPHVRQQPIGRLIIGSSIRGALTSSRLSSKCSLEILQSVFGSSLHHLSMHRFHKSRANQMLPSWNESSVIGWPGNNDT